MPSQVADKFLGLSLLFDGGAQVAIPLVFAQVGVSPENSKSTQVEENDKERILINAWSEHIKELDPEAALFLEETKTDVRIANPSPGLVEMEGQIAQYEKGTVYVNRAALSRHIEELARDAPKEEHARVLAFLTSPVIAHELRHGMTRAKMRAELGFDYPLGSQEDELIAFYHQAVAVKRLYEKHGGELGKYPVEMNSQNRDLSFRLSIGVTRSIGALGGLKSYVDTHYGKHPAMMEIKRENFLRDVIVKNIDVNENRIKGIGATRGREAQELSDSPSPERRQFLEARLARLEALESAARRELEKLEQARAVVEDEEKFRQLQEFYKREIEALENDWQASYKLPGDS